MSQMQKSITVQYYAILRDESGVKSEVVETSVETAGQLYTELAAKHNFSIDSGRLAVAINDQLSSLGSQLNSEDVVVFLPPVAGG